MAGFIRRVVTGHDADGKAIVLSDSLTPSSSRRAPHAARRPGRAAEGRGRRNPARTHHAWSNRSGKKRRLMYVLIDGQYDAELVAALEKRG
jgi:hypothetical protein